MITPIAQISLYELLAVRDWRSCRHLHRLAVASLSEDLRSHVAWSSTGCCQDMKLFFIHNARQSKVSNQQVGIVFWRTEQQVLGLQISVYNSMVVEVGDSGECCSNQVCGIRLVVVALSTDAVEQLASKRKVGHKVYCERSEVCEPRSWIYVQLFIVSK